MVSKSSRKIIIMTEVAVAVERQMVAAAIVESVAVEATIMTVRVAATSVAKEMEEVIVGISMEVINLRGNSIRTSPVNSITRNTSGKFATSTHTTSKIGIITPPQ